MNMRSVFVVALALVMTATLNGQARSSSPEATAQKQPPAQQAPFKWLNFYFGRPLEGKVVKGMPYSAEIVTETVQTLGDGNRIVHRSTSRVYRDSEGRVRREDDGGKGIASITISDPVANKSYTLDLANRTASETPGLRTFMGYFGSFEGTRLTYGYTPLRSFFGTARNAGSGTQNDYTLALGRGQKTRGSRDEYVEEQLANRTIEGVVASGIRRTTTIPQGAIGNEQPIKIVSEEWTSVDLQVLVLTDVNDPQTGRSTYRLTNINRAEPAPALFNVIGDYKIVTSGGRGRGGK